MFEARMSLWLVFFISGFFTSQVLAQEPLPAKPPANEETSSPLSDFARVVPDSAGVLIFSNRSAIKKSPDSMLQLFAEGEGWIPVQEPVDLLIVATTFDKVNEFDKSVTAREFEDIAADLDDFRSGPPPARKLLPFVESKDFCAMVKFRERVAIETIANWFNSDGDPHPDFKTVDLFGRKALQCDRSDNFNLVVQLDSRSYLIGNRNDLLKLQNDSVPVENQTQVQSRLVQLRGASFDGELLIVVDFTKEKVESLGFGYDEMYEAMSECTQLRMTVNSNAEVSSLLEFEFNDQDESQSFLEFIEPELKDRVKWGRARLSDKTSQDFGRDFGRDLFTKFFESVRLNRNGNTVTAFMEKLDGRDMMFDPISLSGEGTNPINDR